MSQRNTRRNKKLRALERAIRKNHAPPANIDLVALLRNRDHADTAGGARRMLVEGRVTVDGEVVGRVPVRYNQDGEPVEYAPSALVPASMRTRVVVS